VPYDPAAGVKVSVQLPEDRVQVVGNQDGIPLKVTVPEGGVLYEPSTFLTVTVQLSETPIVAAEQLMVIVVFVYTATLKVPELPECFESPA
jgi:hypothetical protein